MYIRNTTSASDMAEAARASRGLHSVCSRLVDEFGARRTPVQNAAGHVPLTVLWVTLAFRLACDAKWRVAFHVVVHGTVKPFSPSEI